MKEERRRKEGKIEEVDMWEEQKKRRKRKRVLATSLNYTW